MKLLKKLTQLNIFSDKILPTLMVCLVTVVFLVWLAFRLVGPLSFKTGEAMLIISVEGHDKRMFQGTVVERMSLLDALITSSRAGQIKVEFDINPENKTEIKVLNGYLP